MPRLLALVLHPLTDITHLRWERSLALFDFELVHIPYLELLGIEERGALPSLGDFESVSHDELFDFLAERLILNWFAFYFLCVVIPLCGNTFFIIFGCFESRRF